MPFRHKTRTPSYTMSDPFDRLVVFDFDGTCTLVEKEGKGFVSAVINTLSEVAGRGPETVRGLYEHHQREILKTPEAYDWIIDGVAVCPGTLDPYLRSSHVARKVLESFGISGDPDKLFEYFGLTPKNIVIAAKEAIAMKGE